MLTIQAFRQGPPAHEITLFRRLALSGQTPNLFNSGAAVPDDDNDRGKLRS